MAKLRFSDGCCGRILGLVVMFLLFGSYPFSVVYGASGSGGYRIFTLKHISGDRGKGYLGEAGIGTVSQLSGSPALLVTGGAEEVAKAKAILDLVDAPEEYIIRVILPASEFEGLPSVAEIAGKVGGISVGTFADPPAGTDGARAIIGIGSDSVVVVAPSSRLERIVAAIGQLVEGKKNEKSTNEAEPVESKRVKEAPGAAKIEVVRPGDVNEPNGVTVVPRQEGPKKDEAEKRPLYEPKPSKNADQVLKITLPPELEIVHLMGLVGEYLNLDFMYDPLKIKGKVTLMLKGGLRGPIKVGDLYPLLESVLQFRGFAMTRNRKNLVTVIPLPEVMEKDPIIVETEADTITEHGHVILTRIFKLEHIDVASAQNLLTGMKLGTNVSPVGGAKMLFVTGYAYRMPRVERLLKMIDKPGKPKKIRFRQLQYTMATALAPKIKTLAEQLGAVSITVGQMSSTSAPTSFSGRLPGETTAQYSARLAKDRAARTRSAASRAAPSAPAPQPGVYLDADERTNRILMIGFDEQLDSVEELIDTLDVAQTILRTLKLYKIEHVDAEAARGKLQELGIVSGGRGSSSSTGSRITGGSRVGATTKAPPAPRSSTSSRMAPSSGGALEALVEEPLVVIIEATNSLLVSATAEQHDEIETILEFVDAATEEGVHPYVIYPLENQKPEDLVAILEKLIQETIKDDKGKIEQVIKKTEEEIVIVPDENTFSIIVYASKKNQEWISSLIKTLDKRRPQVLIDVTLVEVRRNDEFSYDLNIIQAFPDLTQGTSIIGGAILPPGATGGGRDRFLEFVTSVDEEGTGGTGFYADKHINFLLTAMQKKGYGRVLAKPKILVNDNEQGSISTTMTKYIEKTSSVPVVPAGGVQQQGIPTFQTAIDYTPYDAGIQLDITPHISEGDLLRLEITLSRSDFEIKEGQAGPPDTTSNDITTVVTVPDGSTIILGGMIKLDQSKGGKKIPLLGDIPFIGILFRGVGNKEEERKLYVFVKAEIIRPAETLAQGLPDLERISDRNRLAFEKFEEEFQSYKSFPGMKSKPMSPLRVLDAE